MIDAEIIKNSIREIISDKRELSAYELDKVDIMIDALKLATTRNDYDEFLLKEFEKLIMRNRL